MIQTFSRFVLWLCLLLSTCISHAGVVDPVPDSLTYEYDNHGILTLHQSGVTARIEVWSENIIRIKITNGNFNADLPYAIISQPYSTHITFHEDGSTLNLATDSIRLVIHTSPFTFEFYNSAGKLINKDEFPVLFQKNETTTYKTLLPRERFLGLGEKTGNLDRRGSGYTNWNTDCYGYTPNTDPMYVSIPFYIGIHDSLYYGIFLNNSSRSEFNFGASNTRFSSFSVSDGNMDYFFISHSSIAGILSSYTELTGRMPLPPRWSLGFQQCRWSYYPDTLVVSIASTFRKKQIPLDVMYLDIDYMDHFKIFTWDTSRFHHPEGMITELKSMGVHTAVIIDPGIKIEAGYSTFDEGLKQNVFLHYTDGSLYAGEVWPGLCHFPDFTQAETRDWWGNSFSGYVHNGVEGFWNDMNEPATWGQRFPSNVVFDFEETGGTTAIARNIYGFQMARATYEGTRNQMQNRRPLILTRSGFAGVQRYSAVWTGDNTPNEEQLLLGVRLVNSLGLSGVPFVGVDVGGFSDNTSPELFSRWITIGAFTPFFRAHKMTGLNAAEPWCYGDATEEIARQYISFRYRLMPYLYSSFFQSAQTGLPVAQSLAIEFPDDDQVYNSNFQNEYLFGAYMLVAPAKSNQKEIRVYLPAGGWYDLYSDRYYEGGRVITTTAPLYRLPLFVKAGAVIPMQKTVQYTSENPGDTLYVHVYTNGNSHFIYYEDDGTTYNYQDGNYLRRQIQFDSQNNRLSFSEAEGNFISPFRFIKVIIHNTTPLNRVYSQNENQYITLRTESTSMLGAFPNNDAPAEIIEVYTFTVQNEREEFIYSW